MSLSFPLSLSPFGPKLPTLEIQAQTASAAEAACFPPVQPVQSVGFCTPVDAAWQIGYVPMRTRSASKLTRDLLYFISYQKAWATREAALRFFLSKGVLRLVWEISESLSLSFHDSVTVCRRIRSTLGCTWVLCCARASWTMP